MAKTIIAEKSGKKSEVMCKLFEAVDKKFM